METVTAFLVVVLVALAGAVVTVAWIWRTLEASQSAYRDRLDKQDAEIESLQQQVHQLHMERVSDMAYIQDWITHGRLGWAEWSKLSGQPPPPEPGERPRPVNPADAVRVAKAIVVQFSLSEIGDLAMELGIAEHVGGDTAAERATQLVNVARQRGLLLRLIELCRRERPNGGF